MSITNTDDLLVNRDDVTYKVSGTRFLAGFTSPPVLGNVSLVETNPFVSPRFTDQSFVASVTMDDEGEPISSKTFNAYVEGRFAEELRSTNTVTAVSTVFGQWYQGTIDGSTATTAGAMSDLAYINNTYIGLGFNDSGVWYTSTDGKSWTSRQFNIANSQWFKFCEFNGKLYCSGTVNSRPEILETSDGFTWTPVLSGKINWSGTTSVVGLSAGDTRVIILPNAGGDGFWYTDDFVTYQPLTGVPGTAELSVALIYGDGVWIWINQNRDFYFRSTDNGDTWETRNLPFTVQTGPGGAYGNDKFITWYNQSNYVVSEDMGLTWEARPFPCTFLALRSLDFADGLYILSTAGSNTAGFYDSYVMMSSDLINWRKINPSTFINADAVKVQYIGDKFVVAWGVASNYGGTIWSDIPIDCKLLSLAGAYTDGFRESMTVSSDPAGGGASALLEINDTEVRVSDQGTWAEGQYLVGPYVYVDGARRYLTFDSDGNVTSFQSNPQSPAYTTTDKNPILTLTFPSTFPSGFTPDEEMGPGVTLTVEATAENAAGASGPLSATVQPEDTPVAPRPYLEGLTTLYTGNSSNQKITNGIDLVNGEGLVWCKQRPLDNAPHFLADTVRGAGNILQSNNANAQSTGSNTSINTFYEDGFGVGSEGDINFSGKDYVAWNFQKHEKYFDVVLATPNTADFRVPHSLGVEPGVIITKRLETGSNWWVYNHFSGKDQYLRLDDVAQTEVFANTWGSTLPSDTEFSLNSNFVGTTPVISYLFAKDTEFVKCGQYTEITTGSGFVELGWRPQWILLKTPDAQSSWYLVDSTRGGSRALAADDPNAEYEYSQFCTFAATGFVINTATFGTNRTVYYVAIAAPPETRSMTQEELDLQKLKFATYDNRHDYVCGEEAMLRREQLEQSLIDAGYTQPEIAATYANIVGAPQAIDGYFPLFETQAQAESAGNGSAHSHVIDGVTYYMPDGGTPIYHGNYTMVSTNHTHNHSTTSTDDSSSSDNSSNDTGTGSNDTNNNNSGGY